MFVNAKIETDRLIIRPYIDEDAEPIFQMLQVPDHYKYIPDELPTSIQQVMRLIQWSKECNEKNTPEKIYKFNLAVLLKETGQFVGVCGLGPCDVKEGEIELYYEITREFQGKGFAKEAAQAIFEYGINRIGLKRIVTTVHPDNLASRAIIEGLGMEYVKDLDGLTGDLEEHNGYRFYQINV
ncbi:GNAT family N-acetyltransferase [Cytobacillus sp. FJAT-54145]|uniref:GNAT family N-acetyltransferase n=1 Tax=Cytobacillus spartinae TaxID=3299023 RepID=A0ABW6KDD5_9BACI